MSSRFWVGLDLGRYRTHVCVTDDTGAQLHESDCETNIDQLVGELAQFPQAAIGLIAVEAGNDAHVVRKLLSRGFPVAIFESRKASKFLAMRRSKTDSGDAKGLADLARLGGNTVSRVYLKSIECEVLRSKLVIRNNLIRLRVLADNALRSRLARHGRPFKKSRRQGAIREAVNEEIACIRREEGVNLSRPLAPLIRISETLRAYERQLDSELARTAERNSVCKLLMGVPGVGPICALSFYTAIEDPMRFRRASDVAAYLGLTPRRYQSGQVSRVRGITKTGSKMTRTHLVSSARVFTTFAPECELKEWARTLRERIGYRRAQVGLARKLAVLMLTMWRNGSHFQPYPTRELKESEA